jgi:hypothetical protein
MRGRGVVVVVEYLHRPPTPMDDAPPTPMDDVPWVLVVRKQNTHLLCQHSNSDCVSEILLLCQHSNSDCVSNSDSVSEISLNHTDRCSELSEQELES